MNIGQQAISLNFGLVDFRFGNIAISIQNDNILWESFFGRSDSNNNVKMQYSIVELFASNKTYLAFYDNGNLKKLGE